MDPGRASRWERLHLHYSSTCWFLRAATSQPWEGKRMLKQMSVFEAAQCWGMSQGSLAGWPQDQAISGANTPPHLWAPDLWWWLMKDSWRRAWLSSLSIHLKDEGSAVQAAVRRNTLVNVHLQSYSYYYFSFQSCPRLVYPASVKT